jgi:hypothetical protein
MSDGAAYLRTSRESSDEARQRETIQSWLAKTGHTLEPESWYFNPGYKRLQADKWPVDSHVGWRWPQALRQVCEQPRVRGFALAPGQPVVARGSPWVGL